MRAHAHTKKVKAVAVEEAKRVVRDAKVVSAKPEAVPEQAAKDQVTKGLTATGAEPHTGTEKATKDQIAKGQTAKGQDPKLQAATVEGGNKPDPTARFVADWVEPRMRPPNSKRPTRTSPKSSLRSLRRCAHLNCI